MEALSITDRQGTEICDRVGRLLATQLDSTTVRNKVEKTVADYLKSKKSSADASDIMRKLDWSVNVRLKK